MSNHRARSAGFTLLEIATSLAILAIITAALVPLATAIVDGERASRAQADLSKIYTAIVGEPSKNTFGYLGDAGTFPASLLDLVQAPSGSPTWWNGPYLTDARIDGGMIYDSYGSPIEYFQPGQGALPAAPTDQLALISRGPDRSSSFTGGANPNVAANFNGATPSSGTYNAGANNGDNVVYPPFSDNPNLASYQALGTLNVNIMNFDDNPVVSALVPACPNYYDVAVVSVPRNSNAAYVIFNPGGASFDLVQGLYQIKVFVSGTTNPIWQEQVSIKPGDTTSRTLSLSGVNSSLFGTTTLTAVNNSGFQLQFYEDGVSQGAAVNNGNTAGPYTVNRCSRITVRNSTSNIPYDTFIQPNGAYTKHYRPTTCTMQFSNQTYNNVAIYDDGLLLGTVGKKGNKRTKTFTVRIGEVITARDETNTARNGSYGASYTVACPATAATF